MHNEQWVVMGLASSRSPWFSQLSHWANNATIPVEFIKCLSAGEVRAQIDGGRVFSALLVGDYVSEVDRDLVDHARGNGIAVIAIASTSNRDWVGLGVDGALPDDFSPSDLMAVLISKTPAVTVGQSLRPEAEDSPILWQGNLIAVTGSGGTGQSTVAMALAQALAAAPSNAEQVLLADFARTGEQAALHDAGDVIPGLQELVEAHRTTRLDANGLRSMVFGTGERHYHLLLGLRQHRAWAALLPRAFEAALDTLGHAYRYVVADTDHDVEGEGETGSIDVEERNLIARTTMKRADLVLIVGDASLKGVHSMIRTARLLAEYGVPVEQMLPVLNRMPKSARRRDSVMEIYHLTLRWASNLSNLPSPVILNERRDLDDCIRLGQPLPSSFGTNLKARVDAMLEGRGPRLPAQFRSDPGLIVPGSLGTWTDPQ